MQAAVLLNQYRADNALAKITDAPLMHFVGSETSLIQALGYERILTLHGRLTNLVPRI